VRPQAAARALELDQAVRALAPRVARAAAQEQAAEGAPEGQVQEALDLQAQAGQAVRQEVLAM
jgi:hypothetical protein